MRAFWPFRHLREIPRRGIDRILIRGTNWLGDVIMSLPAVSAIRNTYPNAKISVLAKPWVAELYRFCPAVDEVIIYQTPGVHEGIRGKFRLARELRKRNFPLAILLQNAIEAAIIAKLAGISLRAGYNTDGRGVLLTHSVPRSKEIALVHQVHYYLHLVSQLGCRSAETGVFLKVGEKERLMAEGIIKKRGLSGNGPLVGMAVGATYGPAKKWFPERFAALADKLIAEFDAKVILMGSAQDKERAAAVSGFMSRPSCDLTGETSLSEAIALIERSNLFISNDSGLMHIAGALAVPTIAIFGSTNPTATSPLGENSLVIYKSVDCSPCLKKTCPADFRCMDSITVDDVYLPARRILAHQVTDDPFGKAVEG
ncbi:MAG: lipopolysaccharide heptosyltransferase II [Smithellaceae bacterium]|nr:lipopolysaccharide heptosyltransferase II [Smithellaceae bacterium]